MDEHREGIGGNYVWWRDVGGAWPAEIARRKRYRLPYHLEEVVVAEYLSRYAPARVLEFGCGFGRHLRYLREIDGLEIHGFDQSDTLIEEMRRWAPVDWMRDRVKTGRVGQPLPYPDGYFDIVFTVSVLIHNRPEDVEASLRELVRVARGHVLLMENPHVEETSQFSTEHEGCWLHPLELHARRLGYEVERLPRFVREHDVYRIRVDRSAAVSDLHAVTLELIRGMQDQLTDALEMPAGMVRGRLAEMTADRDRLWEELQVRCRDHEAAEAEIARLRASDSEVQTTREELGAARERLGNVEAQLRTMTGDRDRLWREVQEWAARHEDAATQLARYERQARWLRTELTRVLTSRSFRAARWLADSPAARAARRTLWLMKDAVRPAVRVRATGRQTAGSSGNEVWILDGDALEISGHDGHWRRALAPSGTMAWRADGEGTLVLPASLPGPLRLRAHAAGGVAEVRTRGRVHRLDLHGDEEAVVEVDVRSGQVHVAANGAAAQAAGAGVVGPGGGGPGRAGATQGEPVPSRARIHLDVGTGPAAGVPTAQALSALERRRSSGRPHLAIAPPDWLGIGASMEVLFGEVLPVPELYADDQVEGYARLLVESDATKIVLGGFAKGYDKVVRRVKRLAPGVRVYATWHGSAAQHSEAYVRWGFNTLHALADEGLVTCVGHTKVGLERSFGHVRYPVRTLLNWYPPVPEPTASPIDDGKLHLGLFTAGSGWRKNVHNQITAAALIPDHALHARVTYPDEGEWARIVRANLVETFSEALPRPRLHRELARMHCNLYVTFAENVPMLPFESLGVGAVAVIGPGGFMFRDHAYLRECLIAPHPDDPVVIADCVRRAVAERREILAAYREFCREYIPRARRAVEEFLAVE